MNTKQKAATLINIIFSISCLVAVYFTLKYAFAYLVPFFVSFIFVYISQTPAISLYKKTGIPKNILTLVFLILILASTGLIIYILFIKFVSLFEDILSVGINVELILSRFCGFIDKASENVPKGLNKYLSLDSSAVLNGISQYASDTVLGLIEDVVKTLPGFIFSTVISIVSACFLAFDYDNIVKFTKRQLSEKSIRFMIKLKKIINYSLFNLFKGYIILMLITLAEVFVGLKLIGIGNAFAISFIIALVDMLPVFGTGIILIPWGLYYLLIGNNVTGICILVLYVVCAVVRYFIEPKIIGKKVGLSPLISLIAMFTGLQFFGVAGLITLPVITSIILILNKNGFINLWK